MAERQAAVSAAISHCRLIRHRRMCHSALVRHFAAGACRTLLALHRLSDAGGRNLGRYRRHQCGGPVVGRPYCVAESEPRQAAWLPSSVAVRYGGSTQSIERHHLRHERRIQRRAGLGCLYRFGNAQRLVDSQCTQAGTRKPPRHKRLIEAPRKSRDAAANEGRKTAQVRKVIRSIEPLKMKKGQSNDCAAPFFVNLRGFYWSGSSPSCGMTSSESGITEAAAT